MLQDLQEIRVFLHSLQRRDQFRRKFDMLHLGTVWLYGDLRSNDNIHLIYVLSSFHVLIPAKIFLTFTSFWFILVWIGLVSVSV